MVLPFFATHKETAQTLRRKAEDLLAQAHDPALHVRGKPSFGETKLNRTGREGDFRQFRDYREGDRPQDIDWKRSARSDDVLIREREKSQQRIWDFRLQNDAGMDFRSSYTMSSKYEISCILALALALRAARRHEIVRVHGEKADVENLAQIMLEKQSAASAQGHKNSIAVLLGDFIQPIEILESRFKNLTAQNVILLQILDPAELDLPYQGRKIFEDGAIAPVIDNVDSVRAGYQAQLQSHLAHIKAYARQRNWHYELIRTNDDLAIGFNRALASLEAAR